MAIADHTPPTSPLRRRIATGTVTLGLIVTLAGCQNVFDVTRPLGSHLDEGNFGNPTMNNIMLHNGELTYAQALNERFSTVVDPTITFAFNSAHLDAAAQATLMRQAAFIRHFPEVQFTVYGHTDLVGSAAYNYRLGLARARAAVNFIVAQGVDRSRLHAVVSRGETQPVVPTQMEERLNRRTVTEVSGFVQTHPLILDGEYARVTYRTYVGGGVSSGEGGGG